MTPRPQSPLPRGLSRRRLLTGLGAGGAALGAGNLLAACGMQGTDEQGEPAAAPVADRSEEEKVLNVSNWPLYIDQSEEDESVRPTLQAFEEKTGIQVNYTEDINDNNEFFGKIRPQLAAGQPTGRDIIVLTDWMAARLMRLGWLQEIDKANVPNVEANLVDALREVEFDPGRAYSVPWQSGFAGIAYNGDVTEPVGSMTELLTRPDLAGRVTALSEMRDTVGLLLLDMGKDPTDFTEEDFQEAIAVLQKAVDSGHIRQFTGNDYAPALNRGDIAAAVAWSGDILQLQFDNPAVEFVLPEAGGMLWSDNMLIPNLAEHKTNAELWMNHYYDPKVAAELAAWVNYISPVDGAQEAMREIDPELAENELIFPTDEVLARAKVFRGLTEDEERTFDDAFQRVTGA